MTDPIDADRLATSEPDAGAERQAKWLLNEIIEKTTMMMSGRASYLRHIVKCAETLRDLTIPFRAPSSDVRSALEGLVEAVRRDSDEDGKGISGFTSARLSDAVAALSHPAPQDEMRRALERAENYFELIRQKLIHNLSEPDRSAFWAAVEARDMIRAALKQGGGE